MESQTHAWNTVLDVADPYGCDACHGIEPQPCGGVREYVK